MSSHRPNHPISNRNFRSGEEAFHSDFNGSYTKVTFIEYDKQRPGFCRVKSEKDSFITKDVNLLRLSSAPIVIFETPNDCYNDDSFFFNEGEELIWRPSKFEYTGYKVTFVKYTCSSSESCIVKECELPIPSVELWEIEEQ